VGKVLITGRRNETPDATHLAEFHQVEGVIADYDITLGHLIGKLSPSDATYVSDHAPAAILEVFMKKAGLGDNLRFKPGTHSSSGSENVWG
jgi:phenylalanyl-tRNA synthetase alpha chain